MLAGQIHDGKISLEAQQMSVKAGDARVVCWM